MDTEAKIQKKINKLKGLHQYKNLTEEQLRRLAEQKVTLDEKKIPLGFDFDDNEDKAKAEELFAEYLKSAHLESPGELSSLRILVDLEIFGERLKKQRDAALKEMKGFMLPKTLMENYYQNIKEIAILKKQLGIIEESDGKLDSFDAFKSLMTKGKIWEKANPNRTLKCSHCQKMLYIRLKDPQETHEAIKHPMFKDKVLYNEALLKAVVENKIDKKLAADILKTSEQYIDWLLEKFHNVKAERENANKKMQASE